MFPFTTKILLADDDLAVLNVIRNLLSELGYKNITTVHNGADAFELIQEASKSTEPFQLCISDWVMPQMTGPELLKKVRSTATLKKLPFILMTSQDSMNQVVEGITLGVDSYIIKPPEKNALSEKLVQVWAKIQKA